MSKNRSKYLDNPCLKEHNLSFDCLNENGFNREKCELYFENYNNCKEFWNKIRSQRRIQGIEPLLPDAEERAKIKAEFMNKKSI